MTEYFVATTGSNTNNGTLLKPWKTIQFGVNQLTPGDTLYVRGGTYHEEINITKSGTALKWITISGYPGETAIIDGEYTLPTGAIHPKIANNPNLINTGNDTYSLKYNGSVYTIYAIVWGRLVTCNANYIIFQDFTITRGRGQAFGATKAGYSNHIWRRLYVTENRHTVCHDYLTNDVLIEDVTSYRTNNFKPYPLPVSGTGLPGGAAYQQQRGVGNWTYRRVKVLYHWGEGIIPVSNNCVIEDCEIGPTLNGGIYIEKSDNIIVQRCLVWGNNDATIYDGGNIGIGWNAEAAGSGNDGTNTNYTFKNNIVVNRSVLARAGAQAAKGTNCKFLNNTFVSGPETIAVVRLLNQINCEFSNNIVLSKAGDAFQGTNSGWTFNSNLWWSQEPLSWMKDSNDIYTNPQLVNASAVISTTCDANNYKLTAISPAINARSNI